MVSECGSAESCGDVNLSQITTFLLQRVHLSIDKMAAASYNSLQRLCCIPGDGSSGVKTICDLGKLQSYIDKLETLLSTLSCLTFVDIGGIW